MNWASIHDPEPSLGPLLLKRTCMVSFTHPALPQQKWLYASPCPFRLGGEKDLHFHFKKHEDHPVNTKCLANIDF